MILFLTIIAIVFALNALLFAWLVFGRYVKWPDVRSMVRRLA